MHTWSSGQHASVCWKKVRLSRPTNGELSCTVEGSSSRGHVSLTHDETLVPVHYGLHAHDQQPAVKPHVTAYASFPRGPEDTSLHPVYAHHTTIYV